MSINKTRCALQSTYVWLPQTMTWLYHQARNVPGWKSVIACYETENLDQFPWPDIVSLRDRGALPYYIHKLHRKLGTRRYPPCFNNIPKRYETVLLHSHFGPQGWDNLELARRFKLAHVVTFYGMDVIMLVQQQPVWRKRYREMFAQVDAVLCEGPHMASRVAELGCPEEKLKVHHLGVDLEMIPFKAREWKPGEPLKILCASSFNEKKGLPYAVESVGMFAKEHRDIDVRLTIIGDANGDPASMKIKKTILELLSKWELNSRTRLLGYQPHTKMLAEAYDNHLFLSPSVTAKDGNTEGGAPVSIIELAASGMPVVSTTHCDIPHVLSESNRRYLVAERDSTALAAAIEKLTSAPDEWRNIGRENRTHIEDGFSAKDQGTALGKIYDSALHSS